MEEEQTRCPFCGAKEHNLITWECGTKRSDPDEDLRTADCINREIISNVKPIMKDADIAILIYAGHLKKVVALERMWAHVLALVHSGDNRDVETWPAVKYWRKKAKDLIADPVAWSSWDEVKPKDLS